MPMPWKQPSRISFLVLFLIFSAVLTSCSKGTEPSASQHLNVILIIVDDLGWMDTTVYGSSFYETPAIDRLASEGFRLTNFYSASPVCSPTRASIMSGKHPARLQLTNWIGGRQKGRLLPPQYIRGLPLKEKTIGEAFKDAGYVTGYAGKWHLGAGGYMPRHQGFDETFAVNEAGQPGSYFFPYKNPRWPQTDVPDLGGDQDGDYLTDRLTDEAVGFIQNHYPKPFFFVLSHYAVHTPIESKQSLIDKYSKRIDESAPEPEFRSESGLATTRLDQSDPAYAGMVESTDESVGRILDRLEQVGISDKTIVVLVSDNGGLSTLAGDRRTAPTSNEPLRSGKGWLYEGGVRVPLIIKSPGLERRGIIVDRPGMTTDLYPTLLELSGLESRTAQHLDGVSLVPSLRGHSQPDRPLFWHFPHYHGSGHLPSGSIRRGSDKLIEWFEDGRVELYDLAEDPGESSDLAARSPEKVEELRSLLHSWRTTVEAGMPTPNPDWEER